MNSFEFIKDLNEHVMERIKFLSQFDGLAEAMLQKAELEVINKKINNYVNSE